MQLQCLLTTSSGFPRISEREAEKLALCVSRGRTGHHRMDDIVFPLRRLLLFRISSILVRSDTIMPICLVLGVVILNILGIFLMLYECKLSCL
jgi:hypothetical protein